MQVASLALVASVTTRFVTQVFVLDTLLFLATAGTAALISYVVSDRLAFRPEAWSRATKCRPRPNTRLNGAG
jgi:hypothetical protein